MGKDIALVYMVAGVSSRFGGRIKQLVKVTETETLIEYSLKQALYSDFTKIVFIVGDKTEAPFKEKFGEKFSGIPVFYAFQKFDILKRDRPWGTADALCCAKEFIDCPFVVCNGDDLYGRNTFRTLVEHLKKEECGAVVGYRLADTLPEKGAVNRGIFKVKEGYIQSLTETIGIEKSKLDERKLGEEDLCSMNIFAFYPEVINYLYDKVEEIKRKNIGNRTIECFLPEEVSNLVKDGKTKIRIYPATDRWFGVTNPGDEETIRKEIRECSGKI